MTETAPYRDHPSSLQKQIVLPDGTELFARGWPATGDDGSRGTAILVHGLGEHGGRYGHVAGVLNELGLDVWAHDHRGFGKSGGARARIPSPDTLLEDLKQVVASICKPGEVPAVLLGHSMGGAIAARAVTGGWISPKLLVLSSPGLTSNLGAPMRFATRLLSAIVPNIAIPHGLPLQTISHDPVVVADAASDPLNHALISPRLAQFVLDAGESAIGAANKLIIPTLVQAAGADKLVDPKGAKDFAARAPAGLCTLKIYDGLWHEIYNEKQPDRGLVLGELKKWLAGKLD